MPKGMTATTIKFLFVPPVTPSPVKGCYILVTADTVFVTDT